MSDLIDRQALKDAHGLGTDCGNCKQSARSCQYDRDFSRMDFCEWLDDAPAIDAVPVVRCKECDNWATKFSSGRESLGNYRCLCQEWSDAEDHRFTYTGENEYCARGERREG